MSRVNSAGFPVLSGMVGDDISAVDNRLKVFVRGVTVKLTFAVNCDLWPLASMASASSQIPIPGSVFTSCGLMFQHQDFDPITVSKQEKISD